MTQVRYVRRSLCECGYSVLKDDVPLGTVYQIGHERHSGKMQCGGCGKFNQVTIVWAESRGPRSAGYLPLEAFEPVNE